MPDPDPELKAEYRRRLAVIDNDKTLSFEGKRQHSAVAWCWLRDQERAASNGAADDLAATVDRLRAQLFNYGNSASDVVVWRSARDRCELAKRSADLVALVDRGADDGDDSLALAALREAIDRNLGTPINRFQERYPTKAALVDSYIAALNASKLSTNQRVRAGMLLSMSKPACLAGMSANAIAALAESLGAPR